MNNDINKVLENFVLEDGIYLSEFIVNKQQKNELKLREEIAGRHYDNYLDEISNHHSIPVMDYEVKRFIKKIPKNGYVIDSGGCWGWHWRNLENNRPDIKIIIVDFVKENLNHAKRILGENINKNIFLVHGDATNLKFKDETFEGYWTVQTFQHIPEFSRAVTEAHRVLKKSGFFANYSLNTTFAHKIVYKIFRKKYVTRGEVAGRFYLSRASREQIDTCESIFNEKIKVRYSEILFQPRFKIKFSGKENSIIGRLDSVLSNTIGLFSTIARQQSFHTQK